MRIALSIFLLFCAAEDNAFAQDGLAAIFNEATVIPALPLEAIEKPAFYNITTNGNRFVITVDKGSKFLAELDSRVPHNSAGKRSLLLSLPAAKPEDAKDKVMFDFLPHRGEQALHIGDKIATQISFDVLFPKTYQVSRFWTIHLQAWQCCGGHPPLSLTVVPAQDPNAPVLLQVEVLNDSLELLDYGHAQKVLGGTKVERGSWIHMELDLKPSLCEKDQGLVKWVVAGRVILDWHGCWGYKPDRASPATKTEVQSGIGVDVGIYRRREAVSQSVLFANLRKEAQ